MYCIKRNIYSSSCGCCCKVYTSYCGAVFAAVTLEFGALKSPILLYILALFAVPEVTEIPKQVVAAVPLASILYILLLNIDGALELLNKLSQYCHWLN
jgi:hypothetical protein